MAQAEAMRLTADLVARAHRIAPDPGPDPRVVPLAEAEREALADRFLAEAGAEPVRVFAYGSLIWRPEIEPAERLRALARGWHRSFCLEITRWRGTREEPGLMMALDRGGACAGLLLRLREETREADLRRLFRREVQSREGIPAQRWIRVETAAGPCRALAFWAGPRGRIVRRRLPPAEVARILARACGHGGSSAEYLYNTVLHLGRAGIRDRNLWRLQRLVAAEIRALHGLS